jgi:hypothetical protein
LVFDSPFVTVIESCSVHKPILGGFNVDEAEGVGGFPQFGDLAAATGIGVVQDDFNS